MSGIDLTPAQAASLDEIVEQAKKHGMEIRSRSDLMLADIGHAVHVSAIDSDYGLYSLVNIHGHHNGVLFYEFETQCSSYEGEEMCSTCSSTYTGLAGT